MLNLFCAVLSAVIAVMCWHQGWMGLFYLNLGAAVLNTLIVLLLPVAKP